MNEMGGEGERAATGGRIPGWLDYEVCSGKPTARQFKLPRGTKADKILPKGNVIKGLIQCPACFHVSMQNGSH